MKLEKYMLTEFISSEKNIVIYDIGCNNGEDSLELLTVFPNSQIYAFEGDTRSINAFKSLVGSTDRITLIESLVSGEDAMVEFYHSQSDSRRKGKDDFWSASSSIKKPTEKMVVFEDIYFSDPILTESKCLGTLKEQLSLPQPSIIWIDVNGAEKDVISGGLDIINETEIIVIEFEEVELYCGASNREEILGMLPNFDLVGVYDFYGTYGNLLLKKK